MKEGHNRTTDEKDCSCTDVHWFTHEHALGRDQSLFLLMSARTFLSCEETLIVSLQCQKHLHASLFWFVLICFSSSKSVTYSFSIQVLKSYVLSFTVLCILGWIKTIWDSLTDWLIHWLFLEEDVNLLLSFVNTVSVWLLKTSSVTLAGCESTKPTDRHSFNLSSTSVTRFFFSHDWRKTWKQQ